MNKIITVLLLLISPICHAGTFGRYGVGVFNSSGASQTAVKSFSVGYEERWVGPIIHQYEIGMYSDPSGEDRKSSGFGFYSLGVETNPGYFVARSLWGIGAITTPDSMLGGWFNFAQDFLIGVRDDRGCIIGLNYKHISSAGIYQPNRGRDFVVIHVEIPW